MIIITGGAGFVGSAMLWALNARGQDDVLVVDNVNSEGQRRNLAPLRYREVVDGSTFRRRLLAGEYDEESISAVIHLAAISSIAKQDDPHLWDINVTWSQEIIRWCVQHQVRCIYASSSAVYGNSTDFRDAPELFDTLRPLNQYGASKLALDTWVRDQGYLDRVVGLRYFNLFGPNEGHKGEAGSLLARLWEKMKEEKTDRPCLELYKSYRLGYPDGGATRDFIYIKDVADVNLFFLEHPQVGGVFNVGTGQAHTFNELAQSIFAALELPACITYVEMSAASRAYYPYHTEADITRLRQSGYMHSFTGLPAAIADCLQHYLAPDRHLGEA